MNLRGRVMLQHPGIQLAPLVDVLLLLLIFFLMTWNAARNENPDALVLRTNIYGWHRHHNSRRKLRSPTRSESMAMSKYSRF